MKFIALVLFTLNAAKALGVEINCQDKSQIQTTLTLYETSLHRERQAEIAVGDLRTRAIQSGCKVENDEKGSLNCYRTSEERQADPEGFLRSLGLGTGAHEAKEQYELAKSTRQDVQKDLLTFFCPNSRPDCEEKVFTQLSKALPNLQAYRNSREILAKAEKELADNQCTLKKSRIFRRIKGVECKGIDPNSSKMIGLRANAILIIPDQTKRLKKIEKEFRRPMNAFQKICASSNSSRNLKKSKSSGGNR